jgi:hypothetical protein
MKRSIAIIVFSLFSLMAVNAQNINGYIVSDTGNITIVKVWGTHYERGLAYGYLCSGKIMAMLTGYILPEFGTFLPQARLILQQGTSLIVDSVYYDEARGMLAGLDSAGQDVSTISYLDVIAANAYLDFLSLSGSKSKNGMGCSSLMSWGNAVAGTDLDGKSVVSRHLDWTPDAAIIDNQMVVIHLPSETNEQPWVMIGFAGQISALSGVNAHMGVFQHMMSDFSGNGQLNKAYEPVWFSLRRALELKDYNGDGVNNVKDMCAIISSHANGYADGYIITMLASSANDSADKIAQVAEIAPAMPYFVFRGIGFPDSITGDNLYAANYEISRNDHYHFCPRYIRTIHAVGNGLNIGSAANWNMLRDSSNSGSSNIQFMQYIPDNGMLNLAVHKHGKQAYKNNPVVLNLNQLFVNDVSVEPVNKEQAYLSVYPNPANDKLNVVAVNTKTQYDLPEIFDIRGRKLSVKIRLDKSGNSIAYSINIRSLDSGSYICRLKTADGPLTKIFSVLR